VAVTTRLETGFCRHWVRVVLRASILLLSGIALALWGPTAVQAKPPHHQTRHVRHVHHAVHHPAKKARTKAHRKRHTVKKAAKPAPPLRAAILIDGTTGEVLEQTNPDTPRYPASLTKMMTLYLTFAALNDGRLSLQQRLPVSRHAAGQEPTELGLKAGDSVRVKNLILGLVTRSANDAAVVLAEGLAGSEPAFAEHMTETARELGMTHTVFRNASGLPDPAQRSTARDMARLALALYQDFPREFDYFSVREFEFRGKTIAGHNHLLDTYKGSDGIKTGFTRAAGFNLAASAERDGHRLIGVVLGSPSWQVRHREMTALLDRGFAELGETRVAAAPDTVLPNRGKSAAARAIARLATAASPVAKAHAATLSEPPIRRAPDAADARLNIQLGAFRGQKAAKKFARSAAHLSAAKGKTVRIVKLPKSEKGRLYAVQLSDFSEKGAQSACRRLKKKMPCLVVPAADES
jgi:D-alanyl-D-alanine carboxypeptidase